MCGISGAFAPQGSAELADLVSRMSAAGRHRGPDDAGLEVFPPPGSAANGMSYAALGHRRLSIIDLSRGGHQPMADGQGRYWIVFNGELYNFLEIRRQLEEKGYRFVSQSDTEVLLAAYEEWGADCLGRMNGMFSFAILDTRMRTLFLARDRFGIKPLHVVSRRGFFGFGSELKQVLECLAGRPRVDQEALGDLLAWGLQGHLPGTFVAGVRQVPAGHYLLLSADDVAAGSTSHFVRYWKPAGDPESAAAGAPERFADLLTSAVGLRLRSDVPLGLTLSGGLDSSSVACIASRLLAQGAATEPLNAFTAVFDDAGFSEERFADLVARRANLRGIKVRPSSGELRKDWWSFVRCMEQPFRGLSYYSNWKIYEAIKETGIKVLLNGQGGDELLLGYERYRIPYLRHLMRRGRWARVLAEARQGAGRGRMGPARLFLYGVYFGLPAIRVRARLNRVGRYLRPAFRDWVSGRSDVIREESSRRTFETWMAAEFERFQLPHLLQHEDRVSMHHAVEARSPFLDYRLYEFVLGCGPDMLIRDGWSKALLREAMKGTLPDEVRLRTDKMGYDTPTTRLFGDERPFFDGILGESSDDPFVDVRRVNEDFGAGSIDGESFCAVISYLSWRRAFGVDA